MVLLIWMLEDVLLDASRLKSSSLVQFLNRGLFADRGNTLSFENFHDLILSVNLLNRLDYRTCVDLDEPDRYWEVFGWYFVVLTIRVGVTSN